MSEASLERELVAKINAEHGKKYKRKDLMEWSMAEIESREGETVYKAGGVYVAMKDKSEAKKNDE